MSNAQGTPINSSEDKCRRETNYVHRTKHKSSMVGRKTTACYQLLSVCLSFSTRSIIAKHTLCMYAFPPSPLCLSLPVPLSSDDFMLLIASQPSCLVACAIQAYWAEERQFSSTQLPSDQSHSSHRHLLQDFLLTRSAY